MRLRKLRYPIAVLRPSSVMGGKNAGLASPRSFNNSVAEYLYKGGYDDAKIVDSTGTAYAVESIILSPLSLTSRLLGAVLYAGSSSDCADVDMDLKEIERLTLPEFQTRIRELALSHPDWWQRHSDREEIENMFAGCETFADSIDSIGVLDPPGKERLRGKSEKVVDLRKRN